MALESTPGPKASDQPFGPNWRNIVLWLGILVGPTANLADIAISHAYVEHAERGAARSMLLVVAAAAALCIVAAGAGALHILRHPRADEPEERVHFMAMGGVVLSVFSLVVLFSLVLIKLLVDAGELT
jgi:hypothetical protein